MDNSKVALDLWFCCWFLFFEFSKCMIGFHDVDMPSFPPSKKKVNKTCPKWHLNLHFFNDNPMPLSFDHHFMQWCKLLSQNISIFFWYHTSWPYDMIKQFHNEIVYTCPSSIDWFSFNLILSTLKFIIFIIFKM